MYWKIFSIYLLALSICAFFLYFADKKRAVKKKWRVPESTLLTLSLIGGAAGGYLAMQLARHKTQHWYFHVVNGIGLIWQYSVLLLLILNA